MLFFTAAQVLIILESHLLKMRIGIPDGDLNFDEEFVCGDYTMMHLMKCFHAVAIAAVGSTSFDYPAEAGFPLG